MTTELRLGRLGFELEQENVQTVGQDGRTLSIKGRLSTSVHADVVTLAEQVNGLATNPDEPVIPLRISTMAHLDGWYRVTSASVEVDRGGTVYGWWPFDATLERVTVGFARFEGRLISGLAPGADDELDVLLVHGVPAAAVEWSTPSVIAEATRASATGDIAMRATTPGICGWTLAPEHAYHGAATIRTGPFGETMRAVTGTELRWDYTWSADNGLVRASRTSGGDLLVESWDGTVWVSFTWRIRDTAGSFFDLGDVATIIRNAAHVVVLRVGLARASGVLGGDYVDLTVHRGCPILGVHLSAGATADLTVVAATGEDGTQTDDTIAADNLTDGLRPAMFTRLPTTQTAGGVLGGAPTTATRTWELGLAATDDASDIDEVTVLAQQWRALAALEPVVGRR